VVNIESLSKGKILRDAICGAMAHIYRRHCVSAGKDMLIESEGAVQRRIRDAANTDGKVLVVQIQHHEKD